jgi:dTDP-4-dehydrorhamnose 3,5-epimerase
MTPELSKQPIFKDHRGSFTPIKLSEKWVQSNISINDDIFVFRGLHLQKFPKSQAKEVMVIRGRILDFCVCVDKLNPNFGKTFEFMMNEGDSLYVPIGYAHGFLTLQSGTIVNYLVDELYSPEHEVSIKWESVEEVKETIVKMTAGFTFKLKMSDKDIEGINLSELL